MHINRITDRKYFLPFAILFVQLLLYIILGKSGWFIPFELFNILLFVANGVIAYIIFRGKADFFLGICIMLIILSHALVGQKIAPDSLTSGAILLVNILILYVGFKIFEKLSFIHFIIFLLSYFVLFYIFILSMENAEALFLLSLMGLAGTARDFKLLSYYWALVIAFTFCQPYAWPAVFISFFFLKIIFSVKGHYLPFPSLIFLGCGLALIFFVLLPVLVLIVQEDPRNIINVLKDAPIRDAIGLTLITATISTLLLFAYSVPFAYAFSRLEFFGKTLLQSFIDIPIIIPQSAAGIALLRVFSKQQFLGEVLFNAFGIRFDGTVVGIILAQIFVSMPFMIKSSLTAFSAVPPALEQNARTLGASWLGVFRRIALPLSSRGLFIGAILAWARAAGEFGAVLFIAPYPQTAPIAVYNRFTSVGVIEAAPLVVTLILFSVVLFFLLQLSARILPQMYSMEQY